MMKGLCTKWFVDHIV